MAWTYDSTDLSTDLAKVRRNIGDTVSQDPGLTDEEIQSFIDDGLSLDMVTLRSAQCLYAKWVRDVDRSNLGMSANRSQKLQHLKDLIDGYLGPRVRRRATPHLGGVSFDEKSEFASDSDFVAPRVQRGQFDNDG